MVLIYWGGFAGTMVAASAFQLGAIRYAIVGILALHTLPTRESLALVQALQVGGFGGAELTCLNLRFGACHTLRWRQPALPLLQAYCCVPPD